MDSKNNANIGFEKQIWDAACVLWGHIPAADKVYPMSRTNFKGKTRLLDSLLCVIR